MVFGKIGILLINLGTPDAPSRSAVYRYLTQFLLDKRVIDYPWLQRNLLVRSIIVPFRAGKSAKVYQEVWTENGSPLKYFGEKLAKGVQKLLGNDYIVALGMRYQNPSIESALNELLQAKVSKILVLPLFPQYASATTGSIHEEVMRILSTKQTIPEINYINSYYDYAPMIAVFAENARKYDIKSYDHILFSYHGLPVRQLTKADISKNYCYKIKNCCENIGIENQFCYSAQCYATSKAIATELGLKRTDYTVCFQSRLGREEWAKPYASDAIADCAKKGYKKILVFSPAFVADCLETTIEIGEEYREEYEKLCGGQLTLVESLNDNPIWIKGVADLIKAKM